MENVHEKGMLLGFTADGNYQDVSLNLNSGDIIFLATDGIIESRNSEGTQFGSSALNDAIKNMDKNKEPNDFIKEEFTKFTSGKFEDDVSLITIKVN